MCGWTVTRAGPAMRWSVVTSGGFIAVLGGQVGRHAADTGLAGN